jgi:hypothetical protein
MKRGLYYEAYRAFLRLRGSPIAAAKEMLYLDAQLEAAEAKMLEFRRTKRKRKDVEQQNAQPAMLADPLETDSDSELDSPKTNGQRPQVPPANHPQSDYDNSSASSDADSDNDEVDQATDGPRGFVQRLKAWWTRTWKGGEPAYGEDPFLEEFRSTNYLTRIWNLLSVARVRRACAFPFPLLIVSTLTIPGSLCRCYRDDRPTALRHKHHGIL